MKATSTTASSTEILENKQNATPSYDNTRKDMFTHLVKNGRYVPGYGDDQWAPFENIPWVNEELLKEGYKFQEEFYAVYFVNSMIFVLGGMVLYRPVTTIVFREKTATNPNPQDYLLKFILKVRGIERLFATLVDPSERKKVFYKIRKLHSFAAHNKPKYLPGKSLPEIIVLPKLPWMADIVAAVKKDADGWVIKKDKHEDMQTSVSFSWDTPEVPVNQFDMICVAFVFAGAVWLNPRRFGLESRDDPKLKAVFHVWAVFCRLLGVQDEFNIFINPESEVLLKLVNAVFLEIYRDIDAHNVAMQSFIVDAVFKMIPFVTQRAFLCLVMEIVTLPMEEIINKNSYPVANLWSIMNWKDRFCYRLFKSALWLLANSRLLRKLTSKLAKAYMENVYKDILPKRNGVN